MCTHAYRVSKIQKVKEDQGKRKEKELRRNEKNVSAGGERGYK